MPTLPLLSLKLSDRLHSPALVARLSIAMRPVRPELAGPSTATGNGTHVATVAGPPRWQYIGIMNPWPLTQIPAPQRVPPARSWLYLAYVSQGPQELGNPVYLHLYWHQNGVTYQARAVVAY